MIDNKIFRYKYDEYANLVSVTEAEREDLSYWEELAKEAVDEAQKELYDKGISSTHGDKKGIYRISPEGVKTYIEKYEC